MLTLYQYSETYFIPIQLVLAMLGMGATLSVRDFQRIAKNPAGLGLGLGIQLVFVPLLSIAFVKSFDLSAGWAVGLTLVAVVPGGAYSNLLTYLGKGNVPLSISVTTISTVGSLVTVPVLLEVMARAHLPPEFTVPTSYIVRNIFFYLLIPLVVGMFILRLAPKQAPPISKWSIRGSVFLICVITFAALGSGRMKIFEYGWVPPALLILFGVLLLNATSHLCRAIGRYDEDTVALGIEVAVRNIGIGLVVYPVFFPNQPEQGHVLYSLLFYGGMSLWVALPMALRHRKGASAVLLRKPHPRPDP